jgi:hypothetical protein
MIEVHIKIQRLILKQVLIYTTHAKKGFMDDSRP